MSQYQPTYQLEPKEAEKFYPSKVKEVIKSILHDFFEDKPYDVAETPRWCEQISRDIRKALTPKQDDYRDMRYSKSVKLDRYKLAIQVTIGEMKGQGLKISSKCLWDPAFDNYASYTFTTEKYY
eukprot:CAMPEP_0114582262 /NCGR_PEP_ID=MMETSP0125-20121206/6288_1 /TAXON_ID=485358 ORGANISM="Aristerostoma sp., Strain ATCC 50986" /NCGR_SAMPLE_ID=MMETSP0125 /ASSEMBLY_ACC=CAM_ASM_000245 /LENGTH=123 /DNA_ID=CAMNT_0001775129 /DNA_START=34 /DNA_END=402 /DNA_ORIENTATION=+